MIAFLWSHLLRFGGIVRRQTGFRRRHLKPVLFCGWPDPVPPGLEALSGMRKKMMRPPQIDGSRDDPWGRRRLPLAAQGVQKMSRVW